MNILIFSLQRSVFDGKKPIRGGIPFVFPNHGHSMQGTLLPKHGFARICQWKLDKGPDRLHTGDVEAIFSLDDTEYTRQMYVYNTKYYITIYQIFLSLCYMLLLVSAFYSTSFQF